MATRKTYTTSANYAKSKAIAHLLVQVTEGVLLNVYKYEEVLFALHNTLRATKGLPGLKRRKVGQ